MPKAPAADPPWEMDDIRRLYNAVKNAVQGSPYASVRQRAQQWSQVLEPTVESITSDIQQFNAGNENVQLLLLEKLAYTILSMTSNKG